MTLLKTLSIVIVSFLLAGCVGVTTALSTKETTHQSAYYLSHGDIKINDQASALRYLGEPEKIVNVQSGTEKWMYKKNVALRGIYIWLVIPLPLVLPVGYNDLSLFFSSDGALIYAISESGNEKGCVTMFLLSGCMPDSYV